MTYLLWPLRCHKNGDENLAIFNIHVFLDRWDAIKTVMRTQLYSIYLIEVAKSAVFEIQKSSHLQPLKWPQVAAIGRTWPHVAGCSTGRIWNFQSSVTCSHLHYLQPLAATCSHLQPLAATCSHLQPLAATCSQPLAATRVAASGRKWPQVAASGRKWLQVAASGRKWPQVAASGRKWLLGRQMPARIASPLKTWKKLLFSQTAFFKVFCETWGESWNERKEITNRREELKRKDGRNEMDELKGKEELNEQDRRVDTKAQTQRIERKSWNGRKSLQCVDLCW